MRLSNETLEYTAHPLYAGPDVEPKSPIPGPQIGLSEEIPAARHVRSGAHRALHQFRLSLALGRTATLDSIAPHVDAMQESARRNAGALIALAGDKTLNNYPAMHGISVAGLMVVFSRHLGFDRTQIRTAGIAGMLLDVGTTHIPATILNKADKLTADELAVIRKHPVDGYTLLQSVAGIPADVLDAVIHHHESHDGSGYPNSKPAGELSLLARMAAICDVFDALTSDRPYRTKLLPIDALRQMATDARFDYALVQSFTRCIGLYPVGSLVRLASERLAIVVEQNRDAGRPKVRPFFDLKTETYLRPSYLDLARNGDDAVVAAESAAARKIDPLPLLWANS